MADIVIADDEPALRRVLCRVLERAGHDVTGHPNGRAAIEHLGRHPADLLITDIFMPEMEGLETIRRARAIRPGMPIIAISGGGCCGANYLWVAELFGAVATLEKPFSAGALLARVAQILEPEGSRQPPQSARFRPSERGDKGQLPEVELTEPAHPLVYRPMSSH